MKENYHKLLFQNNNGKGTFKIKQNLFLNSEKHGDYLRASVWRDRRERGIFVWFVYNLVGMVGEKYKYEKYEAVLTKLYLTFKSI